LNNIYAQIIDDEKRITLVSACTLSPEVKEKVEDGGNIAASKIVGELIAKKAMEKGIKTVVFDRGGYLYHGRVKALAEAVRKAGLQF
jgi:large subunit ribosomal protein L18